MDNGRKSEILDSVLDWVKDQNYEQMVCLSYYCYENCNLCIDELEELGLGGYILDAPKKELLDLIDNATVDEFNKIVEYCFQFA